MFEVANLVSDAMRDIERRDGPFLESGGLKFNASFIVGGSTARDEALIHFQSNAHVSRIGISSS